MAGAVLHSLLEAELPLAEVLIAAPPPEPPSAHSLPVARLDELAGGAKDAGICVRYCGADSVPAIHRALEGGCELLLVACLRTILTSEIIGLARECVLNVHPSKLPAFRGPAPMFWQLRDGLRETAVSVHAVTTRIDAGAVLAHAPVALPDDIHELAAEALAGAAAGEALRNALSDWPELQWRTQDETAATYQRQPGPEDFRIDAQTWTAERAYRFMRATTWRRQPYPIHGSGWSAIATHPLHVVETREGGEHAAPRQLDARTLELPFSEGLLAARGYWLDGG